MEEFIGVITVTSLFGWIPIMVYYKHKIHLEQIRLQGGVSSSAVPQQQTVEELRHEVQQLRDQSTRFDVSFDAALSRIEERVARLESGSGTGKTSAGGSR